MKKCLYFLLFIFYFSTFTLEYPAHVVSWVEENIPDIDILEEKQKQPIYHMVNAFYFRLVNWQEYKPFYDQLYQDPEMAKKVPCFY